MNIGFDMDGFNKEFEDNRKYWYTDPEEAHRRQVENVKKLDAYTGKQSRYDAETGVWNLSDGRQSDKMSNGITGNSIYDDTYKYKNTDSYRKYNDSVKKYSNNAFSYDSGTDPVFKQREKYFTKKAKDAMTDTIAKAAQMTGGIAGSYAVSAGADSYNNYLQELYNQAANREEVMYNRYLDEDSKYLKEAKLAEDEMGRDYDEWKYNSGAVKEKKQKEKNDKAAYETVMKKFQSEGAGSVTDAEWDIIYGQGGWYDPETGWIYDRDGRAYSDDNNTSALNAVFVKFQTYGFDALTEEDKQLLKESGCWYDINTGYLYDGANNPYATGAAN